MNDFEALKAAKEGSKRQKNAKKMQKVLEIRNFALSLHSQLGGNLGCIVQKNAEIAQLVEHNLAKVGVASSSLVFRSKSSLRVF